MAMKPIDEVISGQKRLQIRLGVIMSLTVFEFFIFQLPWVIMGLLTFFQKNFGSLTIGTELSTFAMGMWYIDTAINPLWTTFLTKRKRTDVTTYDTIGTSKTIGTAEIFSTSTATRSNTGPSIKRK